MNDRIPPGSDDRAEKTSVWALLWHPRARAIYKILLAAAVLAVLHRKKLLDFSIFSREHLDLPCVVAAALIVLPVFPIVAWRFQAILRSVGLDAPYPRAFQWTMIGEFFSTALPMSTGGDLVKALYAAQTYGKGRRGIAVLAVLMDRVVGLFGLFLFALLVCLIGGRTIDDNPRLAGLTLFLTIICGGGMLGFWLTIQPWVETNAWRKRAMARLPLGEKLERVYTGLCEMRRRKRRLFLVLGLSLLNHSLWCAMLLVLSRGLGQNLDLVESLVVIPLCLFLNTFGFAGGFGAGELAFEVLFQAMLGAPAGTGTGLAFAYHVLQAIERVLVGLPFYLFTPKPREPIGETNGDDATASGT